MLFTLKTSQKEQKRINECLRLLNKSFRNDFNSVRINTHNNLSHEIAKAIKCYELIKSEKTILTEAIFKSGCRADILILNDFRVIEILDTETKERFDAKRITYPEEVEIIPFKADEIIKTFLKG